MNSPGVDRPAFRAALETLGPGAITVADVGARWGAADAWFRLKPLARMVGFEPDPAECQRLNTLCDPNSERFYPVALGKVNGQGLLHVTREPACSSLFPPSEFIRSRFPSLRTIMTPERLLPVPLTRMDSWAQGVGISRVDFLKLDTQGAELDILQGTGNLLDNCLGIEAEIMFSPLYDGQPMFADVDTYLRSRGFTFWRFDSLAHYTEHPSDRLVHASTVYYEHVGVRHATGDGRLVWANAVYFRDRDTVADPRSLLTLAALLEAAGDHDGSLCCLQAVGHARTSIFLPPDPIRPSREELIASLDLAPHMKERIAMTVGCDDAQGIPKVAGAGSFVVENETRLQIMHNGLKIVEGCYHGAWMTAIIEILKGHHEPQEERAFHELLAHLKPGATMIELGSFWAYYSMWFAKALPGGRVVMVEPDPGNLEVGRKNFALNDLTGEFLHGSIGRNFAAPKPFFCESDNQQHPVPQLCVDDILRESRLPRVDLLLADIQGAELEMLRGASESIKSGMLRFIVVSTHHHLIAADPLIHQKCVEFIRTHGGHVLLDHDVTESFSGDGLIVASFDPKDRTLPPIRVSRNWPSNSLFRELEYDLAEAYEALVEAGKELEVFGQRNQALGAMLNRLRAKHEILTKKWPAFG